MSPSKPARAKASKASPRKDKSAAGQETLRVRWERRNIGLFGAGLGSVIVGYVLLSQGSMDIAPVLLVAGYCVLIPLAFIL